MKLALDVPASRMDESITPSAMPLPGPDIVSVRWQRARDAQTAAEEQALTESGARVAAEQACIGAQSLQQACTSSCCILDLHRMCDALLAAGLTPACPPGTCPGILTRMIASIL